MTTLRPMQPQTFLPYIEAAIVGYAQDNVKAGRWPALGALERSREDFDSLLPQGLATPDNHLFEILAGETGPIVGYVWYAIERKHGTCAAYVYDLEIKAEHQRQGHALRALRALEARAVASGAGSIGLNVFADNAAAQSLYRRLGYTPTNVNMYKALLAPDNCPTEPGAFMQSDETQIRQLVARWMEATRAGDVDTVLDLMAEDAIFLVPGRPPMRKGEFAAAARAQAGGAAPKIDGSSDIQEIKVVGDWAFLWTRLSVVATPPDGSTPIERAGHALTVLNKVNGRWRLARDANLLAPLQRTTN